MLKNEEFEKNSDDILKIEDFSQKNIFSNPNELVQKIRERSKKEKLEKAKNINENAVIEKIKQFLSKIISMQEAEEDSIATEKENAKTTASSAKKEKTEKKNIKKDYILEYYDLPYRYNETIVKILAQTPKKLFVYWDVADSDRDRYLNAFGEKFFEITYPVLLVYNEDKKYVKEVPINDFANSWYIDIDDPKTKYTIQLGRKFIDRNQAINVEKVKENHINLQTDYLPFANSNVLEAPNDHVLLEYLSNRVTFRDVKTNREFVKDLRKTKTILGKKFDVNDFYQKQYDEELSEGMFDMANPSSKLSSSTFK